MNVCSLELSKQLWELSGWNPYDGQNMVIQYDEDGKLGMTGKLVPPAIPAYDLGFILRKLPPYFGAPLDVASYLKLEPITDKKWAASYGNNDYDSWADTPEDAACKLAVVLFQQGILKRKGEK